MDLTEITAHAITMHLFFFSTNHICRKQKSLRHKEHEKTNKQRKQIKKECVRYSLGIWIFLFSMQSSYTNIFTSFYIYTLTIRLGAFSRRLFINRPWHVPFLLYPIYTFFSTNLMNKFSETNKKSKYIRTL